MKVLVFLFGFTVIVATINATCSYCGNSKEDVQEIEYEDLRSLKNDCREYQNNNGPKCSNLVTKIRNILKIVQKYPLYTKEAKQTLKFPDQLNLVDTTEFLANGEIEYRNAILHGMENAVLKDVDFKDINKNLISVHVLLNGAEVTGDYSAANLNKKESGQFYITLKNIEFKTKLILDEFMEILPEIDVNETITVGQHESMYTDGEVLKELKNDNTDVLKPYIYYYNYLNSVLKSRIAKELTVIFRPLIAKRLEQKLNAAIMFPNKDLQIPKAYANIVPGIQVQIYNTLLHDSWNTDKIQKLTNYTDNNDQIEMLFTFALFNVMGSNQWALKYSTRNTYMGKSMFTIDNVQTVLLITKSNTQEAMNVKFVKTTVNGITLMLGNENHCESIRNFAQQRIPYVLEESLKTYFNEQSKIVLRNQIELTGHKYQ
ncbi:uncharacterized protein LOC112691934 [Sipha flava]|uniref:Uncharacterized protein LOC112691934 n=1 Tax=Sipha flava TaxID=143950 RepID=A0A2S2Q7Y6_9HEMI|nr:uncharacterized protein LOC112691934 [Sipha flava]